MYAFLKKFFSLLLVVRSGKLFLLVIAQYLTVYYIFDRSYSFKKLFYDTNLHFLVLASVTSVAAGYLINNFYDTEKDSLEEPFRVRIYFFIGHPLVFRMYIFLNVLALFFALWVSLKAVFFFFGYQLCIWLYSHKISRWIFFNNIAATFLTICPFFVLFIKYENFHMSVFVYACFLFLLLLVEDITKDLATQRGDLIFNYRTLPLKYGERLTKYLLSVLLFFLVILAFVLIKYVQESMMKYYFTTSIVFVCFSLILLWQAQSEKKYRMISRIYDILIILGIFSISLIGWERLHLQKFF